MSENVEDGTWMNMKMDEVMCCRELQRLTGLASMCLGILCSNRMHRKGLLQYLHCANKQSGIEWERGYANVKVLFKS